MSHFHVTPPPSFSAVWKWTGDPADPHSHQQAPAPPFRPLHTPAGPTDSCRPPQPPSGPCTPLQPPLHSCSPLYTPAGPADSCSPLKCCFQLQIRGVGGCNDFMGGKFAVCSSNVDQLIQPFPIHSTCRWNTHTHTRTTADMAEPCDLHDCTRREKTTRACYHTLTRFQSVVLHWCRMFNNIWSFFQFSLHFYSHM